MDVRCAACGTEYEFEDALISSRGTTVRCTNCGHQFKVRLAEAHAVGPDEWIVLTGLGRRLVYRSLRELQHGITHGDVKREDLLSRGRRPPRPIGSIVELEPFFPDAALPERKASTLTGVAPPENAKGPTPKGPAPARNRDHDTWSGVAPPANPPAKGFDAGTGADTAGDENGVAAAAEPGHHARNRTVMGMGVVAPPAPEERAQPPVVVTPGTASETTGDSPQELPRGRLNRKSTQPYVDLGVMEGKTEASEPHETVQSTEVPRPKLQGATETAATLPSAHALTDDDVKLAKADEIPTSEGEPGALPQSSPSGSVPGHHEGVVPEATLDFDVGAIRAEGQLLGHPPRADRDQHSEASESVSDSASKPSPERSADAGDTHERHAARDDSAVLASGDTASSSVRPESTLPPSRSSSPHTLLIGVLSGLAILAVIAIVRSTSKRAPEAFAPVGISSQSIAADMPDSDTRAVGTGTLPSARQALNPVEPDERTDASVDRTSKSTDGGPTGTDAGSTSSSVTGEQSASSDTDEPEDLTAGDFRARLLRASESLQHGQLTRADKLYRSVLVERPNDTEATAGMADVERRRGNLDKAAALYRRVLALNPNFLPALLAAAEIKWSSGDHAGAGVLYRRIVAQVGDQGQYGRIASSRLHQLESQAPAPASPSTLPAADSAAGSAATAAPASPPTSTRAVPPSAGSTDLPELGR